MRRAALDLETTGLDPHSDRVVEIALYVDGGPDEETTSLHTLVDPGRPIPAQAEEVHGIADEDVADAPRFEEVAADVQALVSGAVLVTYNGMRFDTILLDAELRRSGQPGLERDERGRICHPEVDLFALWKNAEPRDLATAVRRFTGVELEGAHSAEADARALDRLVEGMVEAFGLPEDLGQLVELARPAWMVDRDGKFRRRDDGRVVFGFGKHRDELATDHPDYLEWMVAKDFTPETKSWAMDLLTGAAL